MNNPNVQMAYDMLAGHITHPDLRALAYAALECAYACGRVDALQDAGFGKRGPADDAAAPSQEVAA